MEGRQISITGRAEHIISNVSYALTKHNNIIVKLFNNQFHSTCTDSSKVEAGMGWQPHISLQEETKEVYELYI